MTRPRFLQRSPSAWLVLPTLLLTLGINAGVRGVVLGRDSIWYRDAADALIASVPDYPALLRTLHSSPPAAFYLGYVHLLAFCKLTFGARWAEMVVVLQVLLAAVVGLRVVRLTDRVTGSRAAAWTAFALYALAAEIGMWPSYILSDIVFVWLSFALFDVVARALSRDTRAGARRPWVRGLPLLVATIATRPVGLVLIPWLGVAAYLRRRSAGGRAASRPLPLGRVALGSAALFLVASVGYAYVLRHDGQMAGAASSPLHYYARLYAEGVIVTDRPLMNVPPPDSLVDYVGISALRLVHFFDFLPAEFSVLHRLANALFYVPAYALALVGVWAQGRERTALPPSGRTVVLASAALVACVVLLHVHTEIDFDWRYRLPVLPHLVFLAGVGAASVGRGRPARPFAGRHAPQQATGDVRARLPSAIPSAIADRSLVPPERAVEA